VQKETFFLSNGIAPSKTVLDFDSPRSFREILEIVLRSHNERYLSCLWYTLAPLSSLSLISPLQVRYSRNMDQLLKMAADSGMTKEQGQAATGGIFSLVKEALDAGDFNKIVKTIPELEGLVQEHETSTKAAAATDGGGAGGLLGSAMSALGSSGASGSAPAAGGSAGGIASLLAMLSSHGVSAKELNTFMPQVVSLVKTQCGVDISKILGVSGATSSAEGTAAPATAGSSNPLASLMGMFGKK
jgi:hypothetical protein